MSKEFTAMEIMEFLIDFEERMIQRFNKVDERLDRIEQRLDYQETRLSRIEVNMVTKNQFNSLIGILQRNNTISEFEAAHARYDGFEKA